MSLLKAINPHKGEVVRIKFKSINDIILASGCSFSDTSDNYELGDNFKALLVGGDFLVVLEIDETSFTRDINENFIKVLNHLDNGHHFAVYDNMIESISMVEDAEKFVSTDHNLIVVRVGNDLYINGVSLLGNEEEERAEHNRIMKRAIDKTEYENKNRKLLSIFENYITDLAVRDSLRGGES